MFRKQFAAMPIEGKWKEEKGRLKQKFSNLTDQDLHFETGEMDKIFEKLQVKLGKSREEMHKIIEHFSNNF